MPLGYGLLDGLLHEVPVVGRFPRSALPYRGLSDELPGVRAHLVNGDEHGAVPRWRLRHVEQKSLVENDEWCVGPRPGFLVLLSVAPAGNIDPRIYIWEGKRKEREVPGSTVASVSVSFGFSNAGNQTTWPRQAHLTR